MLNSVEIHTANLQMQMLNKHPSFPIAPANRELMKRVVKAMDEAKCDGGTVVSQWLASQARRLEPVRNLQGRWA